jgi:hypothetical protein
VLSLRAVACERLPIDLSYLLAAPLNESTAFPFVIPSAAEGSAVQRTSPGNVLLSLLCPAAIRLRFV